MIYVTENGVSEKMLCTDLCDDWRMKYFKDYINEMLKGETASSPNKNTTADRFYCLFFTFYVTFSVFVLFHLSPHSDKRRREREGLHGLVTPRQLRVGRRILREVRALLRGLQEQKQTSIPEGFCPVLQTHHQLKRLPQSERGNPPQKTHTPPGNPS